MEHDLAIDVVRVDSGSLIPCDWVKIVDLQGGTLSVRDIPSKNGTVLISLNEGAVVPVLDAHKGDLISDEALGRSSDLWLRIQRDATEGWVTSVYTKCTSKPTGPSWTWPVPGYPDLSQGFKNPDPSSYPECGWHSGIDIPAPKSTPIVAASDGVVLHVGKIGSEDPNSGVGPNAVIIQHGTQNLFSTYGHNSAAHVTAGQSVTAGEHIADVGTLGFSTGNHLHFEIIEGVPYSGNGLYPFGGGCDKYRDPLNYVTP